MKYAPIWNLVNEKGSHACVLCFQSRNEMLHEPCMVRQRLPVESSIILVVGCSCHRLISRLQPCSNAKSLGQALQGAWHKHTANHVVYLHSAAPAVRWRCRGMTMSLNLRMVWTEKHLNFLALFLGLHHFQSLITCSRQIWMRKALGA